MISRYFICVLLSLCIMFLGKNSVDGAMTIEQMTQAAKGFRNVCQPKTGVDPAILDNMRKGIFPEDEKFQCYCKCIMNLLKSLKNGRPDLDVILKQMTLMMPQEIQVRSIPVAKACAALDYGSDMCVTAWQYVKCMYEGDPEVFFFP